MIVENRPGAGSTIGYKAAAAADPDGYTLLFGSSGSLGVAPALYPSLDIDPLKHVRADRDHVAAAARHGGRRRACRPTTVAEFIAYAKANPGKLNYGAGLGTPPHLLSTLFKTKAGLDITYVPYKGSAPSVTDLLGGQTHFTIDGMLILIPQVKAGKLRALAVARPERWPELPNVPTLRRKRLPRSRSSTPGPASSRRRARPRRSSRKLNAAINEGLQDRRDQGGARQASARCPRPARRRTSTRSCASNCRNGRRW